MMKIAEVMNSATTSEALACPAVRAGSVAHGTPCVVQETAAAMVSIGIPPEINNNINKLLLIFT